MPIVKRLNSPNHINKMRFKYMAFPLVTLKRVTHIKNNVKRLFNPICHINKDILLSAFANFQASKAVLIFNKQMQIAKIIPSRTPQYKNMDGST